MTDHDEIAREEAADAGTEAGRQRHEREAKLHDAAHERQREASELHERHARHEHERRDERR